MGHPHAPTASQVNVIVWRETILAIVVLHSSRRPCNHLIPGKSWPKSRPRSSPATTLATFFGDPNRSGP
jgi:hypothetical protein